MQQRANPIPESLESVPGFPNTLKIYRIPASRFWYMRAWIAGKMVTRSSKTELKSAAIKKAKDFYNELLLKRAQNLPLTEGSTFHRAAEALFDEDRGRVERGERKPSLVNDGEYILKKDLLPFFKHDHVKNINYKRIQAYVEHLQKRSVSSQTIKNHFIYLRKILKHAHKMELLDKLPIFPTISMQDHPREWFNDDQFETLKKTIRKAIKDKAVVRYVPVTEELMDLTNFTVNSFLRPQDVKLLQHKDVAVIKRLDKTYLRMTAKGKTARAPVISMPAAVSIYERLKGEPEDYVFFPRMKNRDYAMSAMSKQFKYVLEQANLYKTDGADRTLYSLRHTCIMNALLHSGWPTRIIAKNCRTSEEMIERFYGSHLQAEMSVHQLHQRPEPGDTLEGFFDDESIQ